MERVQGGTPSTSRPTHANTDLPGTSSVVLVAYFNTSHLGVRWSGFLPKMVALWLLLRRLKRKDG